MRQITTTYVTMCLLIAGVSYSGAFGNKEKPEQQTVATQTEQKQQPNSDGSPGKDEPQQVLTTSEEKYEPIDPKEFQCMLKDFYIESKVAIEDGRSVGVPKGGGIGQFLCNGQPIELAEKTFKEGFIVTKQFGKFKTRVSTSMMGGGMALYMTPSQKMALRQFLAESRKRPDSTKDASVLDAQRILLRLGYDPGPIDGLWGKKTKVAIEKFQHDKGLSVSGTLDPRTLKELANTP
jgi:hypothetical protein